MNEIMYHEEKDYTIKAKGKNEEEVIGKIFTILKKTVTSDIEGIVIKLEPVNVYEISKKTEEYTETHAHVPFLEGKSSTGRLGIDIHATAGKGDVGFCGHWTLEISVKQPVKIYKGMPIGQLIYFPVEGEIENPYNKKKNAKYTDQPDKPVESMMWKNKF